MAFKPYEKKLDESIDKHSKPKKKTEAHPDVTLDEVYEVATPEERAMIEAICERIDAKEGGAPPPAGLPPGGPPAPGKPPLF